MARKTKAKLKAARTKRGVRSFWSGTISFALVNVPVELFPANRRTGVSFRMLGPDGTPLQRRYYCPEHQTDVHPEHIMRGFPVDEEQYVIVRDEELEAIEPKKSREIDLRRFVGISEISPLFFHRTYYLTPRGDTNKAYRLLADVLERSGRAGIATFVMRDREYLIAIMAEQGILRAATLRFEDEIRDPEDVGLPEAEEPNPQRVTKLRELIRRHRENELVTDWLVDRYSRRVRRAAEKKRRREGTVETGSKPDHDAVSPDEVPKRDLLETIRLSLSQASNGQTSKRTSDRSQPMPQAGPSYQEMNKQDLYELAQQFAIRGRSKMTKAQLINQIQKHSEA